MGQITVGRCAPAQSTAINHSVSYQKLRKKKTGDFFVSFFRENQIIERAFLFLYYQPRRGVD